jgi:2-oxoglutarate ferredoxin oxidoreductase subunit alpha
VALGGTHAALVEAIDRLASEGIGLDYMRIRGFPFAASVHEFLATHPQLFVVEQNRDAQLRAMLAIETGVARDRMTAVLDYGGLPLTAPFVVDAVLATLRPAVAHDVVPANAGASGSVGKTAQSNGSSHA